MKLHSEHRKLVGYARDLKICQVEQQNIRHLLKKELNCDRDVGINLFLPQAIIHLPDIINIFISFLLLDLFRSLRLNNLFALSYLL